MTYPSPYPYFGGKSKVASVIWQRLGDVPVYVEPFLGSAAVFLARPHPDPSRHIEALNDKHGFIPNFWRAVQHDAEQVARYADYPQFECDLHARHAWLVRQGEGLQSRLEGDPDYYDAKIAGWWVWGISLWIGSGFCSGQGPWQSVSGELVRQEDSKSGIKHQRLHQSDTGKGIWRQQFRQTSFGQGIKRKTLHQRNVGQGVHRRSLHTESIAPLVEYFAALQSRFHNGVRVNCGDWTRVLKPSVAWGVNSKEPKLTGIVLDPPYGHSERDPALYSVDENIDPAVRAWALEHGSNPNLRIAYCTYEDDDRSQFTEAGWTLYRWKTHGGYSALNPGGRGSTNRDREVIYFSPHCLSVEPQFYTPNMFDTLLVKEAL